MRKNARAMQLQFNTLSLVRINKHATFFFYKQQQKWCLYILLMHCISYLLFDGILYISLRHTHNFPQYPPPNTKSNENSFEFIRFPIHIIWGLPMEYQWLVKSRASEDFVLFKLPLTEKLYGFMFCLLFLCVA